MPGCLFVAVVLLAEVALKVPLDVFAFEVGEGEDAFVGVGEDEGEDQGEADGQDTFNDEEPALALEAVGAVEVWDGYCEESAEGVADLGAGVEDCCLKGELFAVEWLAGVQ